MRPCSHVVVVFVVAVDKGKRLWSCASFLRRSCTASYFGNKMVVYFLPNILSKTQEINISSWDLENISPSLQLCHPTYSTSVLNSRQMRWYGHGSGPTNHHSHSREQWRVRELHGGRKRKREERGWERKWMRERRWEWEHGNAQYQLTQNACVQKKSTTKSLKLHAKQRQIF